MIRKKWNLPQDYSHSSSMFKRTSERPQLMVLEAHLMPRGYIDGMRVLDLDGTRQQPNATSRGYETRQGRFHASHAGRREKER